MHYAPAKETLKYVKKRREICQKGTENMRDIKSVVKSVVKNVVSARILLTRSERVWLSHFTTPSLLLLLYYSIRRTCARASSWLAANACARLAANALDNVNL